MESILNTQLKPEKKEQIRVELSHRSVWKETGSFKHPLKSKPEDNSWRMMGLAQQIGFTIALPIAGGAITGSYLDRIWDIYPKMTIGLILIGVTVSIFGFIGIIIDITKDQKE